MEEIQKIIVAAGNTRDRLLISLLFESALRIGEALALWLEDIDTPKCTITIRDRGQLTNGAEIKTLSSQRTVHVSRELINEIQNFVAVAHHDGVETNHLFIKLRGPNAGQPLSYPEVNDLFKRLREKTEIEVTPHKLRHTSISAWAAAGQPPERLRKRAGHRQVQSVYRYIHPSEDEMRAASESMQRTLQIGKDSRFGEKPANEGTDL